MFYPLFINDYSGTHIMAIKSPIVKLLKTRSVSIWKVIQTVTSETGQVEKKNNLNERMRVADTLNRPWQRVEAFSQPVCAVDNSLMEIFRAGLINAQFIKTIILVSRI